MKKTRIQKTKYLNPVAQLYLQAKQLKKGLIAGRGFGKSTVNGISIIQKVDNMPRSVGTFLGITYTQILTNTLPPMISSWERYGYIRDVHYVIGKKPPDEFDRPYLPPLKYENVITWWNGMTIIMASFDRPQYMRGGNRDWVITDEAFLIDKEKYDEIVDLTLRGSDPRLKGMPGHLSQEFTSTMPYGILGTWLLDLEDQAKKYPKNVFYIEGTSWHNRLILGDNVLNRWYRDLPALTYSVEVMNKRIKRGGSLFYPLLSDKHFYSDSYNYEHIDSLALHKGSTTKKDSRWDGDVDANKLLNLSFDFGAFNCLLVDQEHGHEIRFVNYMWVTHPDIIDDLVDNFCTYYKHHKNKTVKLWGDKSGNKREANSKDTYFEQISSRLRKSGWSVSRGHVGDIEHLERHRFINLIMKEESPQLPDVRININNCKDFKIALEDAKMKGDKKDKSPERNPRIKQQHATHPTDAFDYRLYWGYKKRSTTASTVSGSVSFGN